MSDDIKIPAAGTTIDDLRKQLEGLKAKAALPALSADEEERAKLRSDIAKHKAKIAENEAKAREVQEDDIFDALITKHADVDLTRVDSEAGMIVLRPPSVAKSRHFQQIATKGKLGPDAYEDYVKPCVVHPDEETLEGWTEKYTMLIPTLCGIVTEVGSAGAKAREKKS